VNPLLSWQPIVDGLVQAVHLIVTGDPVVIQITFRSMETAAAGTGMAALIGMPIGVALGLGSFRGRKFLKTLFSALVGIPTVTLGLLLFALFSRSGPIGYLQLLYTVPGIAIGEGVLVTPLVISFVASAVEAKDSGVRDLTRTLGASEYESSLAVIREAWGGVSLALVSSFNRAFAELGIAMMIGGNIEGLTRLLTTAISLQTNMGELGFAFALSFILLAVVLSLNFLITWLGRAG
jgi:tungstate transport system permease protein